MSYKRVKIIRALKEYGFELLREGSNHTIFSNGNIKIPAGRQKDISPRIAQKISKEINIPWPEFKSKIG